MGPLAGLKIIEMAGIGPGPFAGMMLADMGADVVIIERKTIPWIAPKLDCTRRGKRSIVLDLKNSKDIEVFMHLVEKADVLFEGFRPGVMEKLGIGPKECMLKNPKLIYGRITGWGQFGNLSHAAGHDINYISLTGALFAIGRANENPVVPLNLIGDYGAGALFLVTGILAALHEVKVSGKGQVIDAAMTDGSALLMAMFNSLHAMGAWSTERASNLLDSGAPFYDTYETLDGMFISIGALEPKFYSLLIEKTELNSKFFENQMNKAKWPEMKKKLSEVFKTKTRDQWCDILEGTDVCFAPVLNFIEAQSHHHNLSRNTYITVNGMKQPAPAPRFSRTISAVSKNSSNPGDDQAEILQSWLDS